MPRNSGVVWKGFVGQASGCECIDITWDWALLTQMFRTTHFRLPLLPVQSRRWRRHKARPQRVSAQTMELTQRQSLLQRQPLVVLPLLPLRLLQPSPSLSIRMLELQHRNRGLHNLWDSHLCNARQKVEGRILHYIYSFFAMSFSELVPLLRCLNVIFEILLCATLVCDFLLLKLNCWSTLYVVSQTLSREVLV